MTGQRPHSRSPPATGFPSTPAGHSPCRPSPLGSRAARGSRCAGCCGRGLTRCVPFQPGGRPSCMQVSDSVSCGFTSPASTLSPSLSVDRTPGWVGAPALLSLLWPPSEGRQDSSLGTHTCLCLAHPPPQVPPGPAVLLSSPCCPEGGGVLRRDRRPGTPCPFAPSLPRFQKPCLPG